ncbi:MAG: prefoldin subunit alpha [Candidatus Thorarchaeota archaeon]|nr:prefoldin subunit alpha [Candidatus Thorarchaeota archaeon]
MTEDPRITLEKIYSEQQMTESNLSILQQRVEMVQVYITNYRSGLLVLEEIENRKAGEEMLMNVGGSIFVEAKLVNTDKVTRGIGNGIRIEQNVSEAKTAILKAVTSLESQYEALTQEYQRLFAHASRLNTQFQQLATLVQGAAPPAEEE